MREGLRGERVKCHGRGVIWATASPTQLILYGNVLCFTFLCVPIHPQSFYYSYNYFNTTSRLLTVVHHTVSNVWSSSGWPVLRIVKIFLSDLVSRSIYSRVTEIPELTATTSIATPPTIFVDQTRSQISYANFLFWCGHGNQILTRKII